MVNFSRMIPVMNSIFLVRQILQKFGVPRQKTISFGTSNFLQNQQSLQCRRNTCALLPVDCNQYCWFRNWPLLQSAFGPSWSEAVSCRSPRSITGRDQNGLLFDLGIVLIFVEILNVLNKGIGEDSLDFLGFLTLPPTTSRLYSFLSFHFLLFLQSSMRCLDDVGLWKASAAQ